jgi:hypothetical protein
METFYMVVTLSSLASPQVLFIGPPRLWKNESECVRALPKMESTVGRLIRYRRSTCSGQRPLHLGLTTLLARPNVDLRRLGLAVWGRGTSDANRAKQTLSEN